MPTTDTFGQGFTALDYGDVPDLKVMGDGLLAMAGQTVMRFASASARNATLTSPVAGMTAWLTTEKQLTVYDGASWVAVASGTQSWTPVPLASGWNTGGNDNGDFQYRIVNLFGEPTIMFRGAISRTSWPSQIPQWWVLTNTPLPAAARPTTKRTFLVSCSDTDSDRIALKVDYGPDGVISLWGTGASAKPPWVSFNGTFVSL